jgi:hypothetical protein
VAIHTCLVAGCTQQFCAGRAHEKHAYHTDLAQATVLRSMHAPTAFSQGWPILTEGEREHHDRAATNYHSGAMNDKS